MIELDLIFFPHYNTTVRATPVVLKVCPLGQQGSITWVPLHTFWNSNWLESNHVFFHKPSWWIWYKLVRKPLFWRSTVLIRTTIIAHTFTLALYNSFFWWSHLPFPSTLNLNPFSESNGKPLTVHMHGLREHAWPTTNSSVFTPRSFFLPWL